MCDSHTAIAVGSSDFGTAVALPDRTGRARSRIAMRIMKRPVLDISIHHKLLLELLLE